MRSPALFYHVERPFSTLGLTEHLTHLPPRSMITASDKRTKTAGRGLAAALLLALAVVSAGPFIAAPRAAQAYDNVQLFVTTSSQQSYSFTYTAYNLSGSLVGTYQSQYPAASFELPSGDYLFTVSAVHQTIYPPCNVCAYSGGGVANGGAPATKNATAEPAMPVYYQPSSEYGYLVAHVDSSQTFNIATKNVTDYSTSTVHIRVSFVNGTAAAGASVSASVVGQWAYWWGQGTSTVMWSQTGSDGVATLVVPDAPLVVTAWDWVPIHLPPGQTTVPVNVGGQSVNVTVYWEPSYVGLSGSALIFPPFSDTSITLKYQQPSYWAVPAGTSVAPGAMGNSAAGAPTVASQPSGVPGNVMQAPAQSSGSQTQGQYYLPSQISVPSSGFNAPATGPSQASGEPGLQWVYLGVGAAALAVISIAVLVSRRKSTPPGAT